MLPDAAVIEPATSGRESDWTTEAGSKLVAGDILFIIIIITIIIIIIIIIII